MRVRTGFVERVDGTIRPHAIRLVPIGELDGRTHRGFGDDDVMMAFEPFDAGPDDVERLIGSRGNDRIIANDNANTISGGQGNDYIEARGGDDIVEGGDGNDEIHGGAGNDKLYGGGGNDKLFGEDGNDWLYAKDGQADIVNGGGGTEDHAQRDEGLDTVTGVEIIIV